MSKKIIFITESFLPYKNGGTELYLYNVCKALLQKGVTMHVCTFSNTGQNEYEVDHIPVTDHESITEVLKTLNKLVQYSNYTSLHIHTLGNNFNNAVLRKILDLPLQFFYTPHLVSDLCANSGKLIYKNIQNCNGFVSPVKCQACISTTNNLPSIYSSIIFQNFLQKFIPVSILKKIRSPFHLRGKEASLRVKLLRKKNVRVISVADWYLEILKINNLTNLSFVKQGVSNEFKLSTKNNIGHSGFSWAYVGRLSSEKGIEELITVFIKNHLPGDNLKLFVFKNVFVNEFEENILSLISAYGNIYLEYNIIGVELSEAVLKCNALVLPTKICEMSPLVIAEANYLKLPVLCSNFIRQSSKTFTGLKFNYSNPDDFATKFNQIRNGTFTSKTTETFYQPFEEVAEKLKIIYQ